MSLYNGVDFTGWKFGDVHKGHWTAQDWTMNFDGGGDHLWSSKSYKDFVLIADWRWTSKPVETERPVILTSASRPDDDGTPKTVKVQDAGDSGVYLPRRRQEPDQHLVLAVRLGRGVRLPQRREIQPEVRAGVTPSENADAKIGRRVEPLRDHHEGRPADGGAERQDGAEQRAVAGRARGDRSRCRCTGARWSSRTCTSRSLK